jgi:hypothetical protein
MKWEKTHIMGHNHLKEQSNGQLINTATSDMGERRDEYVFPYSKNKHTFFILDHNFLKQSLKIKNKKFQRKFH